MKLTEVDDDELPSLRLSDLKAGDLFKIGDGNDDSWDYAAFYYFLPEPNSVQYSFLNLSNGVIHFVDRNIRSIWSIIRYKPVGEWKVVRET